MSLVKFYFENEVARIAEHSDGYVHFTYLPGPRTLDQLAQVLHHAGTLLEARSWHRLLNDQRQLAPFTTHEAKQSRVFWEQHTRQLGHGLYIATLVAADAFARLTATAMQQHLRGAGLHYQVFEAEAAAHAWLLKQTHAPALG